MPYPADLARGLNARLQRGAAGRPAVGREPADGVDALVVPAVRVELLLGQERRQVAVPQGVVHEGAALVVVRLWGTRRRGYRDCRPAKREVVEFARLCFACAGFMCRDGV